MNYKSSPGLKHLLLAYALSAFACSAPGTGSSTGPVVNNTGSTGAGATAGAIGGGTAGSATTGVVDATGTAGMAAAVSGGAGTGAVAIDNGAPVFTVQGEGTATAGFTPSDKIDILFVVDNSVSMADKQEILKAAVPDLLSQLTNPACENKDGSVSMQPATAADPCPSTDLKRPFEPVTDIHIAMVTSSLGSGNAANNLGCTDGIEPGDDQAHLIGALNRGLDVPTYPGGFLAWDPMAVSVPPGEADQAALVMNFQNLVDRVGEEGCGFEAPLEAMYRFLIEPDPRASKDAPVDEAILQQRAAFLRPDSVVAIMLLTDENDCSFNPDNQGQWLFRSGQFWGSTSECATDPNHECCRACVDNVNINTNCPSPAAADDPACVALGAPNFYLPKVEDHINVRCFDQKRRFGVSVLYPTERYVRGLSDERIFSRAGEDVLNPLYANPGGESRSPSKVFFVGIVGVPWQDVGTPDSVSVPGVLNLKTAKELAEDNTWDVILGNPAANVPPSDPLARESVAPRAGDGVVPPPDPGGTVAAVNPINGHERNITDGGDLQYACIFPLPMPRDCLTDSGPPGACDCTEPTDSAPVGYDGNPLCRADDGTYSTVQRFAKAYPSPRVLQVLHDLGNPIDPNRPTPTSVVSSICPKNAIEPSTTDYAYRPVIGQLIAEAAGQLR